LQKARQFSQQDVLYRQIYVVQLPKIDQCTITGKQRTPAGLNQMRYCHSDIHGVAYKGVGCALSVTMVSDTYDLVTACLKAIAGQCLPVKLTFDSV